MTPLRVALNSLALAFTIVTGCFTQPASAMDGDDILVMWPGIVSEGPLQSHNNLNQPSGASHYIELKRYRVGLDGGLESCGGTTVGDRCFKVFKGQGTKSSYEQMPWTPASLIPSQLHGSSAQYLSAMPSGGNLFIYYSIFDARDPRDIPEMGELRIVQ